MPIYEYSCPTCGHKFDQLVKMGAPDPECPNCGAETRKLVSAAGFILKGGGWYKDHYGLKKSSGGDAPAKSADSGTKSGGDGTGGSTGGSSGTSGGSGGSGGSAASAAT